MLSAATIELIVGGIQAAITEAPQVVAIAEQGKAYITTLFQSGLISAQVQNDAHAHVDAVAAAFANGATPPEFQVQPDPQA